MPNTVLELCIDSMSGARAAAAAGVHRVELCSDLLEGGITPSAGLIASVKAVLGSVKLHVIIRPRGGDFLYSEDELQVMCADITMCKQLGADGVVFGCLSKAGDVNEPATARLLACATEQSLDFTFHRAFDMSKDLRHSLAQLMHLGVPRVLTSGGQPSVMQGLAVLKELKELAGGGISIMPGGGVSSSTAGTIVRELGVAEIHSSAKMSLESGMEHRTSHLSMCSAQPPSDWSWQGTSQGEAEAIMAALQAAEA